MNSIRILSQVGIYKQMRCGITVLSNRNLLLSNINRVKTSRIQRLSQKTSSPHLEQRYKTFDGVSKDYILIYRTSLAEPTKYVFSVAILIVVGSFCAAVRFLRNRDAMILMEKSTPPLPMKPLINFSLDFLISPDQIANPSERSEMEIEMKPYVGLAVAMFYLMIAIWCQKIVARIWFNPKTNKCILLHYGYFPNSLNYAEFELGTVKLKYKNPKNDISRSMHVINGKTYFLIIRDFKTPSGYERITGNQLFK